MKIVHGPQATAVDRRWIGSRQSWLVLSVLIAIGIIGTLIAAAVHIAMPDGPPQGHTSVVSAQIADYTLDPSTFASIPVDGSDGKLAKVLAQTSSDARSLQALSADQARIRNAGVGVTSDIGPAARPFRMSLENGLHYGRALDCMTSAIYYEAANEPLDGQRAVAQVVINRSRHFAYPHSICGVVYQGRERATGCQFSFSCDGSLTRTPSPSLWARARSVASLALSGLVYAPAGLATHYHADYVVPYWAPTLVKQAVIGRHIFYRWPGAWGTQRSFVSGYEGAEPDIWAGMQTAGLKVPSHGDTAGSLSPAVGTSDRPVLVEAASDKAAAAATPGTAKPDLDKSRVYLMSRDPLPKVASPPPQQRRGVTGGVIMPGTPPPAAPSTSQTQTPPSSSKGD